MPDFRAFAEVVVDFGQIYLQKSTVPVLKVVFLTRSLR